MPKRTHQISHAPIVTQFATKLRELRISSGLTQSELARASSITASYVGRLESGGAAPGIDLLARLAKALGVKTTELLQTVDEVNSEAFLRDRASVMAQKLINKADLDTLKMLCPLLSRLSDSPTMRRGKLWK